MDDIENIAEAAEIVKNGPLVFERDALVFPR